MGPTATRFPASISAAACSRPRRPTRISSGSFKRACPAHRCLPRTCPTNRRSASSPTCVRPPQPRPARPRSATRREAKRSSRGRAACVKCHRVNGVGARVGPDLTRIGQLRRSADLERSLVDPAAEVLPTGRFYRVVTKDGATVTGRLLNIDTFTVQMIDTKEQLRSFTKANLKEHGFIPLADAVVTRARSTRRNSPTWSAIWCR